jgi:hypothetical protein
MDGWYIKNRVFTFWIPHAKAMKSHIFFARHVYTDNADQSLTFLEMDENSSDKKYACC